MQNAGKLRRYRTANVISREINFHNETRLSTRSSPFREQGAVAFSAASELHRIASATTIVTNCYCVPCTRRDERVRLCRRWMIQHVVYGRGGRGKRYMRGERRQGVVRARRCGIVKITVDVYAFMLSYCRRGFTDVYADLRFVLSTGTHCPRNYYSAVAAFERARKRIPLPPALSPPEISNFVRASKEFFIHSARKSNNKCAVATRILHNDHVALLIAYKMKNGNV